MSWVLLVGVVLLLGLVLLATAVRRVELRRMERHIGQDRHVFVEDPEALSLGANARAYGRAADLRDALNGDGVVFEGAGDHFAAG